MRENGSGGQPETDPAEAAAHRRIESDLAASDGAISGSDREQDASDKDQGAADDDQTGSERDADASANDQRAADQDQAASDRNVAAGGTKDGPATASHDAARAARAKSTVSRLETQVARSHAAIARAEAAAERDAVAAMRDEAAAEADRRAEQLEQSIAATNASLAEQLAQVRVRAAADRARAAADRARAAQDRADAAHERARLEAELRQAHLDALTGAFRREMGELALVHEIDRARRGDGRFVLAFVDVDDLKTVNDGHGHAAGDEVLRTVVLSMRSKLRSFDPVVRFGGDEFICGMGGADLKDASQRFAAIGRAVKADVGVGISYGLAALAAGETLDGLRARADAELLVAKRSRGH